MQMTKLLLKCRNLSNIFDLFGKVKFSIAISSGKIQAHIKGLSIQHTKFISDKWHKVSPCISIEFIRYLNVF